MVKTIVHKDSDRAEPWVRAPEHYNMQTSALDSLHSLHSAPFAPWAPYSRSALATGTLKGDKPLWSATTTPSTATRQRKAPGNLQTQRRTPKRTHGAARRKQCRKASSSEEQCPRSVDGGLRTNALEAIKIVGRDCKCMEALI